MNSFSLKFANPWLLLLLIPLIGLALIPYLRLPKRRRRTRNRVVSLIIHILILTLTVPLLCGMTFHTEKVIDTFDVVIVADASTSNETAKETMDKYIEEILQEENASEFNIGIVTFAHDQVYVSEMSDDPAKIYEDYKNSNKSPDASATDIAAALNYAKSLISEVNMSRIIVLSDGLETDGDAVAAAKAIAEEGISVYAIHLDHERTTNEVQVNLVEVSENVAMDDETEITVTLRSTSSGIVKLSLYDNGKLGETKNVTLKGGIEEVKLTHEFTDSGLHELYVEVESENDTLVQNNRGYSYSYIDVSSKVLIVDGTASESTRLNNILSGDCDVKVVTPDKVPNNLAALKQYSEVILMNVDVNDLPNGFDGVLNRFVSENGGGLFTVGGDNTYALGGMIGTRFEEMLPIELDTDEQQVLELMLVMDVSSSMTKTVSDSKQRRIEIAKEGAIESVKALNDSDFVGIVTFDASAKMTMQISPATKEASIIKTINSIQTGMGTQYNGALQLALNSLNSSKNHADKQHVIFLMDGCPNNDDGYLATVKRMASQGITVSTVAIYSENDPDIGDINQLRSIVNSIANVGGGRAYFVTRAQDLSGIMKTETQLSQKELVNEETVYPVVQDYSPVITGIEKLPQLNGYINVKAKTDATVVYKASDSPIYVEWKYGNGMVGSFMSDLSGDWSRQFVTSDEGKTFVRNVVKNLQQRGDSMDVEFVSDNYTTIVNVTREAVAGNSMTANIVAPDGSKSNIILNVTGANGYSGSFPTDMPGVYTVFIEEKDVAGDTLESTEEYAVFGYSKEYDAFADPLDGYKKLDEISKSGNGRIILPTEQLFSKESLTLSNDYDPSIPILIILLILFLLDIAVRKFNFKWPHEIIRDHKEKKQMKR